MSNCPKCAREVDVNDAACRSCGLLRDNFDRFQRIGRRKADTVIERLWRAVEDDWSDTSAHERFVAAAGSGFSFAAAAALYRTAARQRPDDPLAVTQLKRINRMVMAVHHATAAAAATPARRDRRYRGIITLLVVLVLGGAGLATARAWQASPASAAPGEIVSPRSPKRHQPVLTPVVRTASFWERTP